MNSENHGKGKKHKKPCNVTLFVFNVKKRQTQRQKMSLLDKDPNECGVFLGGDGNVLEPN